MRGITGAPAGHLSGNYREPFLEIVDDLIGQEMAITDLGRSDWTQLWNCTDVLPGDACDALDLPRGSTNAMAVRSLP